MWHFSSWKVLSLSLFNSIKSFFASFVFCSSCYRKVDYSPTGVGTFVSFLKLYLSIEPLPKKSFSFFTCAKVCKIERNCRKIIFLRYHLLKRALNCKWIELRWKNILLIHLILFSSFERSRSEFSTWKVRRKKLENGSCDIHQISSTNFSSYDL